MPFRVQFITLLFVLLWAPVSRCATLEQQMAQAWDRVWDRFFISKVGTFGDYLSSYESGREQAHLPTAEEVKRVYPNPCGYGTGMEDGMILNGAMLSILADRYAVTHENGLRELAAKVFGGMRLCATVHGAPGFVARNVCVEDGKSVYPNSSRDQVTHFVHGLWKYYHSPLADAETKSEVKTILASVAERMIKTMVPETNYDFLQVDGKPCWLGICRMWNVQAHEAARLPMIYAAAWDTTHDERYRTEWRRYAQEAVEQSANPDPHKPAYALLQMQCSLEVLHALEPETELKQKIHATMQHVGLLADKRTVWTWGKICEKDPETMSMLGPDWRKVAVWKDQKGFPNPQWGAYREIWHITREVGESALVPLMVAGARVSSEQKERLQAFLLAFDYAHTSSCGILYHVGAYWKARRAQIF